ncbi:hypothetical protein MHO82_23275, partial [Vibrio sp. Of7-15]|uniref:hypothetical protein n=1 Tax=Vibrio sp. Of7-15 TaxID=2724879 RepID=UPI001EF1F5D8
MDDHNNNEQPFRPAGFVPFSLRGMCEKVESTPEPASDAIEEHVEERTPYEYCIEIGCKADVCKKLGIEKLFTLGQTDSEQAVKRFKLVEQGDTTLLVATVYS